MLHPSPDGGDVGVCRVWEQDGGVGTLHDQLQGEVALHEETKKKYINGMPHIGRAKYKVLKVPHM